jgi:phosphoglucomutase
LLAQIKYYLEGSGRDQQAVKDLLVKVTEELGDVWLEADKWGLVRS